MSTNNKQAQAEEALAKCSAYRAAMNAEKIGSRKWIAAEAELNFWQGKAAMLQTEQGWAK